MMLEQVFSNTPGGGGVGGGGSDFIIAELHSQDNLLGTYEDIIMKITTKRIL